MNQHKIMNMSIRTEEAGFTAVAVYFLCQHNLGLPLWSWMLLFFTPDLSMLGYLVNTSVGAMTYNLFHHRAIALVLIIGGFLLHLDIVLTGGILLIAHSSFDRMMGYGLKFPDDFKHTNLGWMGKDNSATTLKASGVA